MMGGAHLGILIAKRPIFNQRERHRQNYLNDESFCGFQDALMDHPEAGQVFRFIHTVDYSFFQDSKLKIL